MYPLSTAALKRAQASRSELARDYQNAFVFDQDGSLRRVEKIEVLGPLGKSIAIRFLSLLTSTWEVSVRLSEPLNHSLEDIKQLLIECIVDSAVSVDNMQMQDSDVSRFVDAVRAASNVSQLVELLKLPAPQDALDIL